MTTTVGSPQTDTLSDVVIHRYRVVTSIKKEADTNSTGGKVVLRSVVEISSVSLAKAYLALTTLSQPQSLQCRVLCNRKWRSPCKYSSSLWGAPQAIKQWSRLDSIGLSVHAEEQLWLILRLKVGATRTCIPAWLLLKLWDSSEDPIVVLHNINARPLILTRITRVSNLN